MVAIYNAQIRSEDGKVNGTHLRINKRFGKFAVVHFIESDHHLVIGQICEATLLESGIWRLAPRNNKAGRPP